ncbi:golgin subfamily A member 2 [Bombina bombina]|uniref:golgin subfamily A member 2 n=1 Tax=Bombina bombina TaxID=8345 RepID=UPI00235A9CAE|nr:golgin subfamily A member 2 [Bombina bombina]
MSEETRKNKLASAKKKLKEFQQKSTPPAPTGEKKKKKLKESNSHTGTPNRLSPDPIQAFLKGLVSDLHKSNGVSIPSLGPMKVLLESDLSSRDAEILEDDSTECSKTPTQPEFDNPLPQPTEIDGIKMPPDGNGSLSSTDSLRQLSEKLNGLMSQSNTYMNGESIIPPNNSETESHIQEMASSLTSTRQTNKLLSSKIEELEQQKKEFTDQIEKQKQMFEQKLSKEQGSLREQLQVHIQTIGILVSEKSELQTALSFTQQAARQKGAEAEDLSMRLQSKNQRVTELERTLSSLSAQQKQAEKLNKELEKQRDNLRLESLKNSKDNEEVKQQNSELSERLNVLLSENANMRLEVGDLHKKLEMADLMIQQFSSQPGATDVNHQLQMVVEERDQLGQELAQIQTLEQERSAARAQVEQLETRLTEVLLASAAEPTDTEPVAPAGPSEMELTLQAEVEKLTQDLRDLQSRYQSLVQDNSQLSRLNQEQEERLQELESTIQRQNEDTVDKQQILENMQSDKVTISRALTQNRQLKEQIAELQNGFVKLTNEKLDMTNELQTEQHVKSELAKKLGELQERLSDFKEQLAAKEEQALLLQTQRDEISAHLQQYSAAYQHISIEKEEIQKQYLLQAQMMDRLQHEEVQGKVNAEMHLKELQKSMETTELLTRENQELRVLVSQIRSDPNSALNRIEGNGVESSMSENTIEKTTSLVPDGFTSRIEMEGQQRSHAVRSYNAADLGEGNVPREVYDALQSAMEKLQRRFTELMQERVELKERVEELECRCIQLSGETDTIGEYITLYQRQRAILKQRHTEKEEYISRLAQDKEEMKSKLLELQSLVMRLVAERNQLYGRYAQATNRPKEVGTESSKEVPMELGASENGGLEEISLAEDTEEDKNKMTSHAIPLQKANPEDPTAEQIMQLLREIQNPQERPGSHLHNPSIPFFYRPDDNGEIRILVV